MTTTREFNPDGTARSRWTDAISLLDLGHLEITRASQIKFNNSTRHWEVIDRRGKIAFFAWSRLACLKWEQENLRAD